MRRNFINRFISGTIILASLLIYRIAPACATAQLPVWVPGSWWDYTTEIDLHLQEDGSSEFIDMVVTDSDTRYQLREVTSRSLIKGSALTYEIYRQEYSGQATGAGTYHTVTPFPLDIPVQLRSATIQGEVWIDVDTLGTVYQSRHLAGQLWAQIPLVGWQQVGTVDIQYNEEDEPPRDSNHFPMDISNTWVLDQIIYTYGSYVTDYDVGQGPQHVEDVFDEQAESIFEMEVLRQEMSGGYLTYRVEGDETTSSGSIVNNYGEIPKNATFEEIANINSEGSIRLNAITRSLTNFNLIPPPTITPTQTPSPKPSGTPSTATPTPFGTATIPPYTATPTPMEATPTALPQIGIVIDTNRDNYENGDRFRLFTYISNPGPELNICQYIILDVQSNYWFWPNWSKDADCLSRKINSGEYVPNETILEFEWPAVEGSAQGLIFWAALVDPDAMEIAGSYDFVEWGYGNAY